jgi:hypothetical protein
MRHPPLGAAARRSETSPVSHLARGVGAGASHGVGAMGLGTFSVALILAKGRVDDLETVCPNNR